MTPIITDPASVAMLFIICIAIGFLASILGVGGGILIVPLLTLVFDVPIHFAIGTSLVCIIGTSLGGTINYLRYDLTNIMLAIQLEIATTIGAIIGGILAIYLFKSNILFILFGLALIYSSYTMLRKQRRGQREDTQKQDTPIHRRRMGTLLCGVAGIVSAMLGVGGGIIKVPIMNLIMKVPLRISLATSNFMIGITATTGAILFLGHGYVEPLSVAPCLFGIIAGSFIGSKTSIKIRMDILAYAFVGLLFFSAIQMMIKGVAG